MLNLYKCEEKPTSRLRNPNVYYSKFVQPLFPNNGRNCFTTYTHNGFAYKLEPGSYFFWVNFSKIYSKRKYMIRVVGDDLKLEMLK